MGDDVQKKLDDQREIWKQQQKTNKPQKEKKRKRQGETKEEDKELKTNNQNKKKKQKQTKATEENEQNKPKKETENDKEEENNTIQVLLAKPFDATKVDPTGYWMSEKMDGVRAYWNGSEFVSRLGNRFHVCTFFFCLLSFIRIC